jgi:hypothetical protein
MSFVFSEVWNVGFEGLPPDTENINLGAGRIRNLKLDIRQRMAIDHQWAGNAFDGKHLQVQLPAIATPPALDASDGCVFASNPAGATELFYRDSSGNTVQLTLNGAVNSAVFSAGTRLPFHNGAPPPGWVQITGYQDRVIRIVDDNSGTGVGGGWAISGIAVSTATLTSTSTSTLTNTSTSTLNDNHNNRDFG